MEDKERKACKKEGKIKGNRTDQKKQKKTRDEMVGDSKRKEIKHERNKEKKVKRNQGGMKVEIVEEAGRNSPPLPSPSSPLPADTPPPPSVPLSSSPPLSRSFSPHC